MKTATSTLKAHLAEEVTTTATLWKITRLDGQVFGFTDHDRSLVVEGVVYECSLGILPSEILQKSDLSVDNLEITGVIDSVSITEEDLLAGKWDGAAITVERVNYMDIELGGTIRLATATLGNVTLSGGTFVAEVRGITQALSQKIVRLVSPMCSAILGDSKCGVNLASYTVSGTVTAVNSNVSFSDSSRAEASGYFIGGKLTFTSGESNGLSFEVRNHAGTAITLYSAPVGGFVVGDTYTLHPGCNHTLKVSAGTYTGDCKTKFNNVVNFQGFPEVPGQKALLS